jgi:hypothetical protein
VIADLAVLGGFVPTRALRLVRESAELHVSELAEGP